MEFKPFKIGKYLLLERLAMGGMAEVYRAKASGAGGFEKQLAIKRILPNYSENDEFRRMFEYEARLSSMLTHANIVQIYDFVKSGETYLLAMEYVDGKNLRQFLNKCKKVGFVLPIEYCAYIVSEICKGLEYAHIKRDDLTGRPLNIIHRDMSPQNVMISYEGSVKIVDFGIAKAKDRVNETRSGIIKGKFGYMSPEQANGESVDHRTDIFSTGIILFELLTNRRLFSTENDIATLKLIQECVIPAPSRINPKIPPDLEKIIIKSLTKDLSLRYQSAAQLQQALQEFLNKHYPSFVQKNLSDAMHRVFQEEIEREKKRFEQIHRQSIPFSQGAAPSAQTEEGGFEQLEDNSESGSVTHSDTNEESDITNADDGNELKNVHNISGSILSGLNSKGEHIPEENPQATRVDVGSGSLEETSISTLGQEDGSADEQKSATLTEKGSNPKINAARPNQRSIRKKVEETSTDSASQKTGIELKSVSNFDIRARSLPDIPHVNKPVTDSIDRTGKSLKNKTDSGVSSLSPMDSAGDQKQQSQSDSPVAHNSDAAVRKKTVVQVPSKDSPYKRAAKAGSSSPSLSLDNDRSHDIGSSFEEGFERFVSQEEKSWVRSTRLFLTGTLLFTLVTGTVFLYKLYMGGGLPNLVKQIEPKLKRALTKDSGELPTAKPADPSHAHENQVGASGATTAKCSTYIDSDPRTTDILVDGKPSGTTPNAILLDCEKSFSISLQHEGYETFTQNIFTKDSNTRIYRTLKKIPQGSLELTLTPGAQVEIPSINYSKYVNSGESISIPIRANKLVKVRFRNDVLSIDVTREFVVTENNVIKQEIHLTPTENRQ